MVSGCWVLSEGTDNYKDENYNTRRTEDANYNTKY